MKRSNIRTTINFQSAINMSSCLNIAIEGCCHGELDQIYDIIIKYQQNNHKTIDLLLICGDFECVRDIVDLQCIAVPQKYKKLNTFHQYVTGEKIAPVLTIFIGKLSFYQ